MLKSRFGTLSVAGFAAIAGVILVASSVGAHHGASQGGLAPFTGISSTTTQAGADVDNDAAADSAAMAAELQKEAAEEAADDAAETDDTETGDINSGDETEADNEPAGTKGAPKTETD